MSYYIHAIYDVAFYSTSQTQKKGAQNSISHKNTAPHFERAVLVEYRALLIENTAIFKEYRALLMEYMTL